MHNIKEKLMNELMELDEVAKKSPSARFSLQEKQNLQMLSETVKNLCKIEMYGEQGESNEGASYRGRSRNSMGRYSRDGYSEEGASYRGGESYRMSGHDPKAEMLERLEEMRREIEKM